VGAFHDKETVPVEATGVEPEELLEPPDEELPLDELLPEELPLEEPPDDELLLELLPDELPLEEPPLDEPLDELPPEELLPEGMPPDELVEDPPPELLELEELVANILTSIIAEAGEPNSASPSTLTSVMANVLPPASSMTGTEMTFALVSPSSQFTVPFVA